MLELTSRWGCCDQVADRRRPDVDAEERPERRGRTRGRHAAGWRHDRRPGRRGRLPRRLGPRAGPAPLRPAVRRRRCRSRPRGRRGLPEPRRRLRLGPGAGPAVAHQPAGRRAARVRGVRRRRRRPASHAGRRTGGLARVGHPARRRAALRAARARPGGLRPVLGRRPTRRRRRCRSPRSWRVRRTARRPPIPALAAHPWLAPGDGVLRGGGRGPRPGAPDGAGVRRAVPRRRGQRPRPSAADAAGPAAAPGARPTGCCTSPAVPRTSSCGRWTSRRSPAARRGRCSPRRWWRPSWTRLAAAQQPDGGWRVDFDSYSPAAALEWRGHRDGRRRCACCADNGVL